MVMYRFEIHMGRVLVIGAGLKGLVTGIREHLAGNRVFIVEKRETIGGRGTSEKSQGFAIEHGPHLLLKGGELHKMIKKVSKIKPSLRPIIPSKILIAGIGPMYPINDPKALFQLKSGNDPIRENAIKLISGWGIENPSRRKALLKHKLCVINEGWAGLVGRLATTLEEVGVPIQCNTEIIMKNGKPFVKDGPEIEADRVYFCVGPEKNNRIEVSTYDIILNNNPLGKTHALIKEDVAIMNLGAIHTNKLPENYAHLSCISIKEGVKAIEALLDERLSGWRNHIVTQRINNKITLSDLSGQLSDGVLMKKEED